MSTTSNEVTINADYWIKVNLAVEIHLKAALLEVLHNAHNDPSYTGLPTDEIQLHQWMLQFKTTRQQALQHVLKPNHWAALCPVSGQSDSKEWDISLIIVVIINLLPIPPPQGGWKKQKPQSGDNSLAAFVLMARWLRNEVKHGAIRDLQSPDQFKTLWKQIKQTLQGLHYDVDKLNDFDEMAEIGGDNPKTSTESTLKLLEVKQAELENDLLRFKSNELTNADDIQIQLNNFDYAVKAVQPDLENFFPERKQNLSSAVSRLTTTLIQATEDLNARLRKLEQTQNSVSEPVLGGAVLDDVLSIVIEMLARSEWEKLLHTFNLTFKEKFSIFLSRPSTEILRSKNLSWFDLKKRLLQLHRGDVVKKIKTKTLITTGFKSAFEDHKEHLRQNFMAKRFVKPFLGATGETELDDKDIEQAFIDLAIIKGKSVDEKFLNSDRDYHLQQLQLQKKYIQLGDLLTKEDRFIIISGVPGIGKSTLVKKVILEWEQGRLLNGKKCSPNIRLLFPILCRELNALHVNENDTPEEILKRLFPDFFSDWKMIKEMNEYILFVIDGVDELRSIDDIQSPTRPPAVNLLYHLMKPGFLGQHKCVFVGRPRATRMLQSFCKKTFQYAAKKVEVCGFSKESVEKYFMKQFDEDTEFGQDLLHKIKSSPITDGLSRIPLHAWVLTSIFKDNPFIELPQTATELLLYSFLIFIRRQKEKQGNVHNHYSLKKLSQDPKVISNVLAVAELSYKTLLKSEIIFEATETDALIELENMGLIVKSIRRETDSYIYQFQHLTFQELFAAVHVLLLDTLDQKSPILREPILQACLTIVAGLEGIAFGESSKAPTVLQNFLKELVPSKEDTKNKQRPNIIGLLQNCWSNNWIAEEGITSMDISDKFIEAFFESQLSSFAIGPTFKENRMVRFVKDENSSPLTQYPLHRLSCFTYALIQNNPTTNIALYPILTTSFGMERIEKILLRCENVYVNFHLLSENEKIHLLSFIVDQLLSNTQLEELTINFSFTPMNKAIRDLFLSLFRAKHIKSLILKSVEICEALVWQNTFEQLHQNITLNQNLKKLTLFKCGLTDDIFSKVDVSSLGLLTHLDVSYNGLSQISLNHLLYNLPTNSTLETINFRWNEFQDLADAHHHQDQISTAPNVGETTISQLDITQCAMGDASLGQNIISNLLTVVRHLTIDRFLILPLKELLTETMKDIAEDANNKLKLESIYIADIEDERFGDYFNDMREQFNEFDVVLHRNPRSSAFNALPDWFDICVEYL